MPIEVVSLLAHYEPFLLHNQDTFGDAGSSGRKTSLLAYLEQKLSPKASAAAFSLVLID